MKAEGPHEGCWWLWGRREADTLESLDVSESGLAHGLDEARRGEIKNNSLFLTQASKLGGGARTKMGWQGPRHLRNFTIDDYEASQRQAGRWGRLERKGELFSSALQRTMHELGLGVWPHRPDLHKAEKSLQH